MKPISSVWVLVNVEPGVRLEKGGYHNCGKSIADSWALARAGLFDGDPLPCFASSLEARLFLRDMKSSGDPLFQVREFQPVEVPLIRRKALEPLWSFPLAGVTPYEEGAK